MPAPAQIQKIAYEIDDNDYVRCPIDEAANRLFEDCPPSAWFEGDPTFSKWYGSVLALRDRGRTHPEDAAMCRFDGGPGIAPPTFETDSEGRLVLVGAGTRGGFAPPDKAALSVPASRWSIGFIGSFDDTDTTVLTGTHDDSAVTNDYLAPIVGSWNLSPHNARPAFISRSRNTIAALRDVTARDLQNVFAAYLWTFDVNLGRRIFVGDSKVLESTDMLYRVAMADTRIRLFRMNTASASQAEFKGKMNRLVIWPQDISQVPAYLDRWNAYAGAIVAA